MNKRTDRRRAQAGVMLLCLLASSAPASASPGLTIEEAVSRALARAPELAAIRHSEEAAQHRVSQTRTAYLPRVNLEASYSAHWPKNELPIDLTGLQGLSAINPNIKAPEVSDIDDYHRVKAGGSVSMRVLDFSRGSRVAAAQSSLAAEQARSRETAAGLAFQVRASFLAALFARDLRQIARSSLELAEAEEKRAKLRSEVGTGSQLALAQARVRVAGLRAQLRQSENELDRQRRQVASLLGVEVSTLAELQGELQTLAGPVPRRDLGEAPGLLRLRRTAEAAELQARSTDRAFWPTVGVMARADYEYPHAMRLEWGPTVQGGISLSWDLFDGGLRRAQTREARASARALGEQASATEQGLRRRLIDLEARTRGAQADLRSARETLVQQEIYVRVARASLQAGTGTQLDVFTADLGLDRARIAVQQALLSQALARSEALMVHGIVVEGSGVAPANGGSR